MKRSTARVVCLLTVGVVFGTTPARALTAEQEAKLLPADGGGQNWFGRGVALDGDTVIVGAPGDDDNGGLSGSAYVFTHTGSSWTEQAKLLPADGAFRALFGWSVALDGDTAVIGAQFDDDNGYSSGSAYVFRLVPEDGDGDGVLDDSDFCPDTIIPESVPTSHLGVNRWALVDDDGVFDTTPPPGGGGGPEFVFSVATTGGCSCEQIIDRWALGWGHTKFGCSTGAMLQWIAYVQDFKLARIDLEPRQTAAGANRTPMESPDDPSASAQGAPNDPASRRQQSLAPRRTHRPRHNEE